MRQGEAELEEADSGLKKLMRRVIPGLASPQTVKIETRNEGEGI
jgi:hypothetical protein